MLNQAEFTVVLKEIHLAESTFEIEKNSHIEQAGENLSNSYKAIFEAHQIKEEDFQATLDYYSRHPKELEIIYDKVIEQLVEEKTK